MPAARDITPKIVLTIDGKPFKPTGDVAKTYGNVKKFGAAADRLYILNKHRLAAQKLVEQMEAEEKAIRGHLSTALPQNKLSSAGGEVASVKLETSKVPQLKDKPKFIAYCVKHKRLDLIGNTVSVPGVREIWDDTSLPAAKRVVPGVEPFEVTKLSCTKK